MAALHSFIAASVSMAVLWGQGTEYPALKYRSNYLASYYLSHAPNTTPWWPSWSPDGKWIVYTADDDWKSIQLEIVNVATGEIRKLTNDNQLYVDPVFSSD